MSTFDLSMLDLPRASTPVPAPAPSPEPEAGDREGSPNLDDATLESVALAEPEPEPEPETEDARILRGWNASLDTMSELHETRPDLFPECFEQLEAWLRRWEVVDVSASLLSFWRVVH